MLYSKIFKKIVIVAVFTAQTFQVIGGGIQSSVKSDVPVFPEQNLQSARFDFADITLGGFFAKASRVFTSAVHEMGHALTAKLFFGKENNARINLGSRDAKVWYANKFVTVRKDIFFPAQCQYAQTEFSVKLPQQGLKSVAVLAAGPAAGLVLAGCMGYAAYRAESCENKNVSPILYATAAAQVCSQAVQFLPQVKNGLKHDGEQISEMLKFSETTKKIIARSVRGTMAAALGIAGWRIWNVYSSPKTENQI